MSRQILTDKKTKHFLMRTFKCTQQAVRLALQLAGDAADQGAGADARRKVSGRLRAGMRDHAQRGGQNDRADVRAEGEDGL